MTFAVGQQFAGAAPLADGRHDALRALFIRRGSFSHTNESLIAAMRRVRPDIAFDDLDVEALLQSEPTAFARRVYGAVREYGIGSLRSRTVLRHRISRNAVHNEVCRNAIRRWIGDRSYVFSLQTQSLFNAATGRFPNFIYTDHVAYAREHTSWDMPSQRWIDCETRFYFDAAHVFTFGPSVRRLLIERYKLPTERVTDAGGGANVTPSRPPSRERERYARRRILYVGRDWTRKGGPDLLAAFREVRARLPDATLTIAGCNPPEAAGVEGCVVVGLLPPAETEQHFREASCLCVPSRMEPFGVVYAEAAHFALPVVATTVGDIGTLVRDGENGWRVPPRDPAALAAALIRVLEDPDVAQRMGANGVSLAARFNWDAVAERILRRVPLPALAERRSAEG